MSKPEDVWAAVDRYVAETLVPADAALDAALRDMEAGGLPAINVTPAQGKMLALLVKMAGCWPGEGQAERGHIRVLEIGTLGGYSTIWLGRAVGDGGEVVSLEISAHHAEVARKNIERAGLSERVRVIVGRASETLATLAGVFDFIFIDADKASIPAYFDWSMKLSRPGTVIFVDNVVRGGKVVDGSSSDESVLGVRRFNALIARDPRVEATTIQTVGGKGYDGFTLVRVK